MSIFTEARAERQAAELKRQEEAAAQAVRDAKMTGIEFQGVMCSAHKEDQWGLDSVEGTIRAGQPVPFHFKNGNVLVLTAANFDAFEAVWKPFRMGFFL